MKNVQFVRREQVWSGLVLLVVAGMLLVVYFLRLSNGTDLVDVDINPNLVTGRHVQRAAAAPVFVDYRDTAHRFSVRYPEGRSVATSQSAEGDAVVYTVQFGSGDQAVYVSVMPATMEGQVRNSVGLLSEVAGTVQGMPSIRIEGSSLKDGSPVQLFLVRDGATLFTARGTGQSYVQLVDSFQIL
ncbi:MAG: hypothetical protein V1916_03470 [Patescibacteria group bacterium]